MDNEFLSSTLQHALDEAQKTCPEIKTVFALDQNQELIAQTANTPEDAVSRAIELIREILDKTGALGGPEGFNIEGAAGRIEVSVVDEIYLVTVTSKKIDTNTVNLISRVLIPTILHIAKLENVPQRKDPEKLEPEPETPRIEEIEEEAKAALEIEKETKAEKPKETQEPTKIEPSLVEAPINQFIVEDLKGLLAPSDIVRIDNSVIEQWKELYNGRNIEEADVETFEGKSLRCKIKPIKDGKLEGQGKIQIPSKLQLVLDIKKGELLRVKPAVE